MSAHTAMRKSPELVGSIRTPKHYTTELITQRQHQVSTSLGPAETDARGVADTLPRRRLIFDVSKMRMSLSDQLGITRPARRARARAIFRVRSPGRQLSGICRVRTPRLIITRFLKFPRVRRRLVAGSEEIAEMIWMIDCQRRRSEHLLSLLRLLTREGLASMEVALFV